MLPKESRNTVIRLVLHLSKLKFFLQLEFQGYLRYNTLNFSKCVFLGTG